MCSLLLIQAAAIIPSAHPKRASRGKDWVAIESILQESDHEAGANIATETNIIFERRNSHGRKSPRLGRQGQENLCRALCREIQVYKKILSLASNLSTKDKVETLKELAETCPQETRDSHCSVQYDGELASTNPGTKAYLTILNY